MIIHPYSHGSLHVVTNYYGHGFGSVFARLFSKIAAKTASRAAMSAAKRVGSKLVRTGIKKVIPIAKKTLKSAVKTGIKKATPIAKDLVKKGVKRATEEANNAIANKVQKVENYAIKKGVSPDIAHSVSDFVKEGSQKGLHGLSNLAESQGDRIIDIAGREVKKSIGVNHHPVSRQREVKPRQSKRVSYRVQQRKVKPRQSRKRISYQIQNLIDSA